jgi:ankyrin repeat protein
MEYLIFCNANRHAQNKRGWTPLHYAASLGRKDFVSRLIIDPGSLRSIKDGLGSTPLHEAVRSNQLDCVKLLVDEGSTPPGADRNAPTLAGNTPMHLAAFLGYTDIVEYLITQNADCNIRNHQGQFAMDLARTEEICALLKNATTIRKKCCWYCCFNG